jgi:hypothetical protein
VICETDFEDINEAKANLDHIYNQSDPRAYFRELKKFDYVIPEVAKPIFKKLIEALQQRRENTIQVLDLGCSYGINAALLKHDLSMDELYDHWGQKTFSNATSDAVIARDQIYFADLKAPEDIGVVGFDVAQNATSYGEEVGLLDESFTVNLETELLSASAKEELALVDLVTSTGCVGYVTEKSFDRMLPAMGSGQMPWFANFVCRMFPFDAIEECLDGWGYVTEKLQNRTFLQRRFASVHEQEQVIGQLRDQGVDPTGLEGEGDLLAEFYLSRPTAEAAAVPIERLLAV